MTERKISHLRYLALAMPNFEEERDFFIKHWGLIEVKGDENTSYLAAAGSDEAYVVRLRKGEKRIDLVGFAAKDRADVDSFYQELLDKGVQMVHPPQALTQFDGGYGFRFFDVDGRTLEISTENKGQASRPVKEREAIPVKLSHVVFNTSNLAKTTQWWLDVLGFSISDSLVSDHMGDMMHFLRCNKAHHSIAVAQGPHHSLHHMSFEMRGIEEWMRGAGKILRAGTRMVWGLGRHNAGDNTFAYFIDPAGNTVEYTTELATIEDEDAWEPHKLNIREVTTQDQWGTANPMSEFVARESFNDVDHGLFVAPPL